MTLKPGLVRSSLWTFFIFFVLGFIFVLWVGHAAGEPSFHVAVIMGLVFGVVFTFVNICRFYFIPKGWKKTLLGVPYDFSRPSWKKVRERCWNPNAPVMTPKVWGWGWTVNFYPIWRGIKKMFR